MKELNEIEKTAIEIMESYITEKYKMNYYEAMKLSILYHSAENIWQVADTIYDVNETLQKINENLRQIKNNG